MRREMTADGRAGTKHRAINDFLAVNGMGNGLAHLQLGQCRVLVVGGQNCLAFRGAESHGNIRVGLQGPQTFRRAGEGYQIQITGHHGGDLCRLIVDEAELDLGQLDRAGIPVARVLFHQDAIALDPADEFEGPGAHGFGRVGSGGLLADNHGGGFTHPEQERGPRFLQGDAHGMGVRRFDLGHVHEALLTLDLAAFRRIGFESVFHIGRIKIRAVVELHALDQVEGIN